MEYTRIRLIIINKKEELKVRLGNTKRIYKRMPTKTILSNLSQTRNLEIQMLS